MLMRSAKLKCARQRLHFFFSSSITSTSPAPLLGGVVIFAKKVVTCVRWKLAGEASSIDFCGKWRASCERISVESYEKER